MLDENLGMYSIKNRATIKSTDKNTKLDEKFTSPKPNIVTCKLGKVFPSKHKATEHYIIEKLNSLGKESITYYDIQRYVSGKVNKDCMDNFGPILNKVINSSDEFVRMDRGRYSKGNALKRVSLDNDLLKACTSRSDGVLHYIQEFTKEIGYYRWSDVQSYVKKHVPPSWMGTFSNVFSRYTNESGLFRKSGTGVHYKMYNDENKPISREGKEFSNIQEGLRYYIIDTLKNGNSYSSSELYEKVKTRVPPHWMRNFSQCVHLSYKNNILQRAHDKKYKLKGDYNKMDKNSAVKTSYVCKNNNVFKYKSTGLRHYIQEYFNIHSKGRHKEIREYIEKQVPHEWLNTFDTVFDRYSKDSANNIVKVSRGLYAIKQDNENQLKVNDEEQAPYNYNKKSVSYDNKVDKPVETETNNQTTNNEITKIKHKFKQHIEHAQHHMSQELDSIDYNNLDKDGLLEVIELKDLIIKLNNVI